MLIADLGRDPGAHLGLGLRVFGKGGDNLQLQDLGSFLCDWQREVFLFTLPVINSFPVSPLAVGRSPRLFVEPSNPSKEGVRRDLRQKTGVHVFENKAQGIDCSTNNFQLLTNGWVGSIFRSNQPIINVIHHYRSSVSRMGEQDCLS